MCVACFTTAQLATVGAVSARWWWVNKWNRGDGEDDVDLDGAPPIEEPAYEEPVPVA